jgi:uncharacterized cupredoxin-like copper-binding protein
VLGLAALLLVFAVATAAGQTKASVPTITVTLGKPSEYRITVSRASAPVGTVTFKVTNKGKKAHSFKVCAKPSTPAAATSCGGDATKLIAPGKTGKLTVTLDKGGHLYLSSAAGDAKRGMKGTFTSGAAATGPDTASTIKVTLGSPDEYAIALDKGSVGFGEVTFNVTNKGKQPHSFKICTNTTYSIAAFACVGKATKTLVPGESEVLVADLAQGIHEYLSSVGRDAFKGMKGGLDVIEVFAPNPVDTTPETPCPAPKTTTVDVEMFEYGFKLSDDSVPCGTVIFRMTNTGTLEHNFNIARYGEFRAVGETLGPGFGGTMRVVLDPGPHPYICDVPGHAFAGQTGTLKVIAG